MRHIPGQLLIFFIAVSVIGLAWPRSPVASEAPALIGTMLPPVDDHGWSATADRDATWMGVASCAAASCHHNNGPKGAKRSEYDTWASYDKHARAYQVLYNERSQRIARNLYGEGSKPATEQALCLKCHASHEGVTDKGVGEHFQLADGVGCESCHGAAEKWLTIHYQPGFKEMSLDEKAALGMRPTKDILYRAKLCTECHIGNADKEVNHDLIAAGHPRLSFELGAYHGIYNKHWNILDDHARYSDFEARLWAVGQIVSARAALELLKARADGATAKEGKDAKPWPEFSEYGCFACHKDLQVNSPRQTAGYEGRRPGSLPWGNWYLSPANPLTGEAGMRSADDSDPVKELRNLMQAPSPDRQKVARAAEEVLRKIDGVLNNLPSSQPMNSSQLRSTMERLAHLGADRVKAMSWDEATQLYLALAALQNGLSDFGPGDASSAVRDDLEKMSRTLRQAFPQGSDSPTRFNPFALDADLKSISGRLGN